MSNIKALTRRLLNLIEASDENYSDVNYGEYNIDQLFKDKSITKIRSLNVAGTAVSKFPMQVTYIAEHCNIDGHGDTILELPKNLTIGGTLYIGPYSNIKQLPKGLKVGSLGLHSKIITELPDDLQIKNTLNISAPVKRVENISCKHVILHNSHIKIIRNVHATEYLRIDIDKSQSLKIYPDVICDGGITIAYKDEIYEFQDILEVYAEFPELAPDEFKPFDYSDEDMKNFEKAPKNESLINRLYALTEEVGGDYNKHNIKELLTNRNITEIQSFNTLGAEIYRFPRQVHYIAGDCWIDEYCGIAELPDDLTIGGVLTINYSKALDMLPDGLKVGSLRLWSHIVTEIPDDLQVSHNLDITAPVKKVENFSCNNVYLFNKGELTHLKNVHAKGTLTIYLYENRPLTIYPDVTADKGIIVYYIYENHKKQTYNFADVTELYAEFPQLAPDEFKPFDYSDEDME